MRINALFGVLAFVGFCAGCEPRPESTLEANKDLVRQFTEISNAAEWDRLGEIVAPDLRRHSAATAGPPIRSLEEFIALQRSFLMTFPDQRVHLEAVIAEGDYVAVRARYTGTQTGPMGELPATGKPVDGPFIAFFRIESGKIAELWVEWDNVAMLSQLGMFPLPTPPTE